jgi:hypothetical protein
LLILAAWSAIIVGNLQPWAVLAVDDQELKGSPFPYGLRSLRTVKGARIELARLYQAVKAGDIEPHVAGRLTHILSVLIGSARDHEIEARMDALEKQLGKIRANGHDRAGLRQ